MKRVMIVGGPGSGKSTLARWLGGQTGLPVHHMDHIHWLGNWVERSKSEKLAMAATIEAQERWIFEGSLTATYDNRAARADTLIWLDLPVGLRLWRVTKRRFRYWGRVRPDMSPGCIEGLNAEVLPFYAFIWRTRHSKRTRLFTLLARHSDGLTVHHLRSRAEVAAFRRDACAQGVERQ
ncbi:MAG: DNA topology modulation protein FlaR [Pseudomonadota bacterium]